MGGSAGAGLFYDPLLRKDSSLAWTRVPGKGDLSFPSSEKLWAVPGLDVATGAEWPQTDYTDPAVVY